MRIYQENVTVNPSEFMRLWIQEKVRFLSRLYHYALYGVMQDTIDVLTSMLIGNPDWVTVPEDPRADALFTILWQDEMDIHATDALRNYLIAGCGGVAITPLGIGSVSPLNFACLPDYFDYDIAMRLITMPSARARNIFGRFKGIDETEYVYGKGDDTISAPLQRYYPQAYSTYEEKYVDIIEVWNGGEWQYYTANNKRIGDKIDANSYEGYFYLLGDRRPEFLEPLYGNELAPSDCSLIPIGMVEKVVGLSVSNDVNIVKELNSIIEATIALAKRQALLFVRKGAVVDQRMIALLENNYKVIWVSDNESTIETTDKPTIADLQVARQSLSEQLISRTGVSSYQRGVPAPGVNMATEAALLQANSNVRVNRLQVKVARWLTQVSESYKEYLVRLYPEYQEPKIICVNGITEEIGGIAVPYSQVLAGISIYPATGGFSDMQQRREELIGAIQAASLAPGRYDIGKMADSLLMTYRVDPALLRNQQAGGIMLPNNNELSYLGGIGNG